MSLTWQLCAAYGQWNSLLESSLVKTVPLDVLQGQLKCGYLYCMRARSCADYKNTESSRDASPSFTVAMCAQHDDFPLYYWTIYKKPGWVFTGQRRPAGGCSQANGGQLVGVHRPTEASWRPDLDCPTKVSWRPDFVCVRHWQSKVLARQFTRFLDHAQPTIIFFIPHVQPQYNHW